VHAELVRWVSTVLSVVLGEPEADLRYVEDLEKS